MTRRNPTPWLHAGLLALECVLLLTAARRGILRSRRGGIVLLAAAPLLWRAAHVALIHGFSVAAFRRRESTVPLSPRWFAYLARSAVAILEAQLRMAAPFGRSEPRPRGGRRPLVMLVHGYACNSGVFLDFPERLRRRGIDCAAIELSVPMGDLPALGRETARWIAEAHAAAPERPLVLMGVSMGGLVARLALERRPDLPVAHLVTLSAPHPGTLAAKLGFDRAARQMRPDSRLIAKLASLPPPCPTTSFWTPDDTIILPPDAAILAGSVVAVPGYSHFSVIAAPQVEDGLAAICDGLQTAIQAPPAKREVKPFARSA